MTAFLSPFQFGTLATNDNFIDRVEDRALIKQVLNINTPMFQNDTENLSSTQIEMLKAIANGEQHFSAQSVKQIYHLGNPNTIVKNKKTLQNKDIIERQKDNFVFVDPIYRLWFKGEYC